MEKVAAFRKTDGKVNLVFLESQKTSIEKALGNFVPKIPDAKQNTKIIL